MLTIGTEPRMSCGLTPAGFAHSVGVSFLEMAIVARGAKKTAVTAAAGGLPRFVDVKLDQLQKKDFAGSKLTAESLVVKLQDLCDAGYRVGCSWSGENQTYTVSLTCRDEQSPNNGCCMTSFAGQLDRAVSLALYKHYVVCGEVWSVAGHTPGEDFG